MIITPRLRAALTTRFMRGAIDATRCADIAQVCVSHISQMMMAVRATGHCLTCSVAPASFVRRRARRLSVPGTFGRFGSGAFPDRCGAAASNMAPDIDPKNDLRLTRLIKTPPPGRSLYLTRQYTPVVQGTNF